MTWLLHHDKLHASRRLHPGRGHARTLDTWLPIRHNHHPRRMHHIAGRKVCHHLLWHGLHVGSISHHAGGIHTHLAFRRTIWTNGHHLLLSLHRRIRSWPSRWLHRIILRRGTIWHAARCCLLATVARCSSLHLAIRLLHGSMLHRLHLRWTGSAVPISRIWLRRIRVVYKGIVTNYIVGSTMVLHGRRGHPMRKTLRIYHLLLHVHGHGLWL
mmetsp:Transcript_145018/g.255642  ORF Transcript_145018/g.255642 Transcript_145018/m.255642 type:complete len:213 (+) Transcript_145018:1397-2035(+)